jgi:hypothetical protein
MHVIGDDCSQPWFFKSHTVSRRWLAFGVKGFLVNTESVVFWNVMTRSSVG